MPLPRSPASGLLALTHLPSAPPISSSHGFSRFISVPSSTRPSSLNFIAVKCSARKAVGRPTCPSGPRASLLQVRSQKSCALGPCSALGRWRWSGARGLAGHGVWETQVPLVQTATRSKGLTQQALNKCLRSCQPVSLKEAVNHRGSRKLPKGLGPSAERLVKQSEKLNTLVLSCSLLGSPWARAVTAEAANPFPAPRLFPRGGPQDSVRSLLTPTLHTPVPFRLPRYPSL